VQFDHEAGVDLGGLFRAALTLAFEELIAEKPIGFVDDWEQRGRGGSHNVQPQEPPPPEALLPPEPILRAVNLPAVTILVPRFLGHEPSASTEVLPRISPKRSALYYLGRLCSFALLHNLRIPDVLDDRFWQCLVGGQLFLTDEEIQANPEFVSADKASSMFRINGTPVDLIFPLQEASAERLYSSNLTLLREIASQAEAHYQRVVAAVPRGERVPTRAEVPYDWIDMAALSELTIHAQHPRNDVQSALDYCSMARDAILSGRAFKKHFSEFRNGFRQSFGTVMLSSMSEGYVSVCKNLDLAFKRMTVEELRAFAVAPSSIIRSEFVQLFYAVERSCVLSTLAQEALTPSCAASRFVSVYDVLSTIASDLTSEYPSEVREQAAFELSELPEAECRPRRNGRRSSSAEAAKALVSTCKEVVNRLLRHKHFTAESQERLRMVRAAVADPSLCDDHAMSEILFAATGSRYTVGIRIGVQPQSKMRYVVFHTCSMVMEVPRCRSPREMAQVLLDSAQQGNEDGFGLV